MPSAHARPSPASSGSGLTIGGLMVVLSLFAVRAEAQDPPTGGGTGCQSHGNCQGTMYKDKSNLDRWWYRTCSGCHTVQAPPPKDIVTTPTAFQREVLADEKKFKALHDRTLSDPVLKVLVPKARLIAPQLLQPPFSTLMKR